MPKYQHDCETCTFLGTVSSVDRPGQEIDLYFHRTVSRFSPTVIARYSSEGADYGSGLTFGVNSPGCDLAVALRKAYKADLITDEEIQKEVFPR